MTQCDVVIVNFNAGDSLKKAMEGALQSHSVACVCVVDNASTDNSLDLVSHEHGDRLRVIRNTANLGFAAACNIGFAHTTAENVLLLNPDCQVIEGAVERLTNVLRSADHVGMVGPLLLNPDGSEQAGGRRRFPMPRLAIQRVLGSTYLGRFIPLPGFLLHQQQLPEVPLEVEAISGACMMVRREAAAAVGPLDEGYFLHCEDLDWCMRFHQHGWSILFVPDAKCIHMKGVSSSHRPLFAEYHKHKGIVRFYRKFLPETYPHWQMALVIAGVWFRFIGIAVARLITKGGTLIWNVRRSVCWALRA